jgi:CheY-like chemotaxis protein
VTPKLLLADDSVTIQRVIELTFADEDVQVLAVGDGQQAIDRVKSDRPDIVLADVGMPERDGYEVAAFIKGDPSLSHIPVLLLTGAFEPIDEARARAVGCDGVLVKPFEPQMVISRVRDLLAGKRAPDLTAASTPAPAAAPAEPAGSLEAYFDRLDAALASKGATTPTFDPIPSEPRPAAPARPALSVVPNAEAARTSNAGAIDLGGWTPPAHAAGNASESPASSDRRAESNTKDQTPTTTPGSTAGATGAISLDQAFAALLAAEQGQTSGLPLPFLQPASREWPKDVPDSFVDAVVAKVLARMGDESMRTAVLDAAERLVREEIDRIKNARTD